MSELGLDDRHARGWARPKQIHELPAADKVIEPAVAVDGGWGTLFHGAPLFVFSWRSGELASSSVPIVFVCIVGLLLGGEAGRVQGLEMENLTRSGSHSLTWPTCNEEEQSQSFHRVLRVEALLATVGLLVLACLLAAFLSLRKPFKRRVLIKSNVGQAGWLGVVGRSLRFCSLSLRLLAPSGQLRSWPSRYVAAVGAVLWHFVQPSPGVS